MNTKIPFSKLSESLSKAGASDIEGITVEEVTKIHNAVVLKDELSTLIEEIKSSVGSGEKIPLNPMCEFQLLFLSLLSSLGFTQSDITKEMNAKKLNSIKSSAKKAKESKPKGVVAK